jgi:hypothetical protein
MSTPQDPGSGDTPQDPADPQNPYGTPPPPPNVPPPASPPPSDPPTTAIPPAPPVYGTEPTGAPTTPPPAAPPYGDPTAPAAPPAAPAYGQPAYGQPQYGQPGLPQYPATTSGEPGKGMAITALIASIFGCTCLGALIAIPLAIVVLLRSRDGRNHGKGLAIAALIISVISVIGVGAGGYGLYNYAKDFKDVSDLRAGDCITAKGLTDSDSDSVTEIKGVKCSEEHDGEVLATVGLTQEQADSYETTPFSVICDPAIEAQGKTGVLSDTVTYTALTVADPGEGDIAACVAYNVDGSKLTSRLGS